jgi:hypothetical protein
MRTSCGLTEFLADIFAKKMTFWEVSQQTNDKTLHRHHLGGHTSISRVPTMAQLECLGFALENRKKEVHDSSDVRSLVRSSVPFVKMRAVRHIMERKYHRETTLVSVRAEGFSIDRSDRRRQTTIHHLRLSSSFSGSATKHGKMTW